MNTFAELVRLFIQVAIIFLCLTIAFLWIGYGYLVLRDLLARRRFRKRRPEPVRDIAYAPRTGDWHHSTFFDKIGEFRNDFTS